MVVAITSISRSHFASRRRIKSPHFRCVGDWPSEDRLDHSTATARNGCGSAPAFSKQPFLPDREAHTTETYKKFKLAAYPASTGVSALRIMIARSCYCWASQDSCC